MKLELFFTDAAGRRWSVWDWRVIAKQRARVWPGMPESEWRTFVSEDGVERRHYRFRSSEARDLVPEVLAQQLAQARLEISEGRQRAEGIHWRQPEGQPAQEAGPLSGRTRGTDPR